MNEYIELTLEGGTKVSVHRDFFGVIGIKQQMLVPVITIVSRTGGGAISVKETREEVLALVGQASLKAPSDRDIERVLNWYRDGEDSLSEAIDDIRCLFGEKV